MLHPGAFSARLGRTTASCAVLGWSDLAARIMHRSCAGCVQVAAPLGEPEAILTVGSEEYPRVVLPSVTGGYRVKPRCSSA